MTNSLSNYSLKRGFDNDVSSRNPNPPDPVVGYPSCILCEDQGKYSHEDMVLIHETRKKGDYICPECVVAIKNDVREAYTTCYFCDDEFPLYYSKVGKQEIYICDDCMERLY